MADFSLIVIGSHAGMTEKEMVSNIHLAQQLSIKMGRKCGKLLILPKKEVVLHFLSIVLARCAHPLLIYVGHANDGKESLKKSFESLDVRAGSLQINEDESLTRGDVFGAVEAHLGGSSSLDINLYGCYTDSWELHAGHHNCDAFVRDGVIGIVRVKQHAASEAEVRYSKLAQRAFWETAISTRTTFPSGKGHTNLRDDVGIPLLAGVDAAVEAALSAPPLAAASGGGAGSGGGGAS